MAIVRSAWMSDDAYITLRSIDNWVNGFGPRWNVSERVQTFTHPLWFLLLSGPYAVTREAFLTPLALSATLATTAFWLAVRHISTTTGSMVLAGAFLICSKALVEYSTSGLENPLTHLLLVCLILATLIDEERKRTRAVWAIAGMLMLDRLDLALFVAPVLLLQFWIGDRRTWLSAAAVGMCPLVLWEIFSLAYYGFPFPNTAYAKLLNGIPTIELIRRGGLYLVDTLNRDPLTLFRLGGGLVIAFWRGDSWGRALAAGCVLYLSYVVGIGGDFMLGRFLAAPFLVATCLLAASRLSLPAKWTTVGAAVIATIGLTLTTRPPILTTSLTFDREPGDAYGRFGIDDERAIYSRYTGLLRYTRAVPLPHHADVIRAREIRGQQRIIVTAGIGLFGYFAGPSIHLVDPLALGDPLLARLPPKATGSWRIGHFERAIPDGYIETLQRGEDLIRDRHVRSLYDEIAVVTRGPLWSAARWHAIAHLNGL